MVGRFDFAVELSIVDVVLTFRYDNRYKYQFVCYLNSKKKLLGPFYLKIEFGALSIILSIKIYKNEWPTIATCTGQD